MSSPKSYGEENSVDKNKLFDRFVSANAKKQCLAEMERIEQEVVASDCGNYAFEGMWGRLRRAMEAE